MNWISRYSLLENLIEVFLPEIALLAGVLFYLISFFFKRGRYYLVNFYITFSILFLTGTFLVVSPTSYDFESVLVSCNFIWLTKILLLLFSLIFILAHVLQVHFAWFLNSRVDIDLGSKYFEYNLIVLVLLLTSFITLMANDFILLVVGLEVISIGLYILTSLTYEKFAVEAALKYFFPGVFFSLIVILGIIFIFWAYGTFNFKDLKNLMHLFDNLSQCKLVKLTNEMYLVFNNDMTIFQIFKPKKLKSFDLNFMQSIDYVLFYDYLHVYFFPHLFNKTIINEYSEFIFLYFSQVFLDKLKWLFLGLSLILFGLLGKLGVFPGHFWVLDVYYGTSTLTNFYLSIFPKLFYIILLVKFRILFDFLFLYTPINFIFLISGILSIIYGISVTLNEWSIKKFLAGSSIVNLGFIILFLGLDTVYLFKSNIAQIVHSSGYTLYDYANVNVYGLFGVQFAIIYFNLIIYLVSLCIFFYFYLLLRQPSDIKEDIYLNDFRDFSLLKSIPKKFLFLFTFILFSFAGIPPLSGFFGKFLFFEFLFRTKNFTLLGFLLIVSIITTFYYIRVVRYFLFSNVESFGLFVYKNDFLLNIIIFMSYLVLFIIFFGFSFFFNFFFDFLVRDLFLYMCF